MVQGGGWCGFGYFYVVFVRCVFMYCGRLDLLRMAMYILYSYLDHFMVINSVPA